MYVCYATIIDWYLTKGNWYDYIQNDSRVGGRSPSSLLAHRLQASANRGDSRSTAQGSVVRRSGRRRALGFRACERAGRDHLLSAGERDATDFDRMLQAPEVAEILDVSLPRVYELVRTGVLPAVRLGRQIRVDPRKLQAFLDGGGQCLPDRRST